MKLDIAQDKAERLMAELKPFCSYIAVVGSIRRRCSEVKDIDLIIIPSDHWGLNTKLKALGTMQVCGTKMARYRMMTVQVDIYFANKDNLATLTLIRTGSAGHNVKLCSLAKAKGWKLCASGEGLFDDKGERIAGDTERSIFEALGERYKEPQERN